MSYILLPSEEYSTRTFLKLVTKIETLYICQRSFE